MGFDDALAVLRLHPYFSDRGRPARCSDQGTRGVADEPSVAGERPQATLRKPGQHAYSQVRAIGNRALTTVGLAVLALIVGLWRGLSGLPLTLLALAVIVTVIAVERRYAPRAERWRRGADGEREVGRVLAGLESEGWLALHDVSLGRGNVDHVLVGPGGIFAIETKSHPGKIGVDRVDPHMLKQAYAERKLIERITGLETEALLVFSRAWLIGSVPARRNGVTILPARMLEHYFSRRRPSMTAERAAEIHAHLAHALSNHQPSAPWD